MIIDGTHIGTYGAIVLDLGKLVEYPKLKKVETNDWAEHDGLEVDLSDPKLDKRTFSIEFYFTSEDNYKAFVDFLLEQTYRIYNVAGNEFKLRVNGFSDYAAIGDRCKVKIHFTDDFPLRNYTYETPTLSTRDLGFLLDNINFKAYGIVPIMGTKDNVLTEADIKDILEISNSKINGVVVHNQQLKQKSKTIEVKCFIHELIADFWQGYNAFLHDLTKPELRVLTAFGEDFNCYYKNAEVNEFVVDNKIWCKFDIKLEVV